MEALANMQTCSVSMFWKWPPHFTRTASQRQSEKPRRKDTRGLCLIVLATPGTGPAAYWKSLTRLHSDLTAKILLPHGKKAHRFITNWWTLSCKQTSM